MGKFKKPEPKPRVDYKFCPLDGKPLEEYPFEDDIHSFITCGEHVWQPSTESSFKDSLSLESTYKCQKCGKMITYYEISHYDSKKYCQTCGHALHKAWRCDPDKSYATFHILHLITEEGDKYGVNEKTVISPYPNPVGFGGCSGGGAWNCETLEGVKAWLTEQAQRYIDDYGITRINIIEEEPETITAQPQLAKVAVAPKPEKKEPVVAAPAQGTFNL